MKRSAFALLIFMFGISGAMTARAENASLYETLRRRAQIKVFVATPSVAPENKALDPALVKQAFEKAFQERKSIKFKAVTTETEAELAVDAELKGFLFTENDPVDMLVGVGAAAMDAATQDHYAATEALVTIRDTQNGKILWKDDLRATVTDHTMTESESRQRVSEKLAEQLMREAFGKKRK